MSVSPYISSPNILDAAEYTAKAMALTFGDADVIKAGTPIDADGAVANDETAIGVLLADVHKELGAVGQVVIFGFINTAAAQTHSGVTVTDAAKRAMKNLKFSGDTGVEPVPMPEIDKESDIGKVLGVTEDGTIGLLELEDPEDPETHTFTSILIHSSTAESEKVFAITVDDDGELTATEVTE